MKIYVIKINKIRKEILEQVQVLSSSSSSTQQIVENDLLNLLQVGFDNNDNENNDNISMYKTAVKALFQYKKQKNISLDFTPTFLIQSVLILNTDITII